VPDGTIDSTGKIMIKIRQMPLGAAIFSLCAAASAANLVANGSFETGDLSGWTQSGNTDFPGVLTGFTGTVLGEATHGSFSAFMGPVGSDGFLSQTLSTVAGQSYTLSFDLADAYAATGGQDFALLYNGTTLYSITGQGNPSGATYDHLSFTVAGTNGSTLEFAFRPYPSFFGLDDVVVTQAAAVPAPAPRTLLLAGIAAAGFAGLRRRPAR
jgi:hypothetical protein